MVGLAIDIGTTNIDSRSFSLDTGELLSSASEKNPQSRYGADVISRVMAARSGVVRDTMTSMIREAVQKLKDEQGTGNIGALVVVGNTVMLHFLCGLSVEGFAASPFKAVTLRPALPPPAYIPPCIGAFLGADFIAGVAYVWKTRKKPFWLLDLGTNCEIGFFDGEKLLAASAAAGSAFERGASLLRDAADDLTAGRITSTGLVAEQGLVSQREVRKLQLAKGAVGAALKILFAPTRSDISSSAAIFLGGAFGNEVSEKDARTIGLIPDYLRGTVENVGNAALDGAAAMLFDKDLSTLAERIAARSTCWDLGGNREFEKFFIANLDFPVLSNLAPFKPITKDDTWLSANLLKQQ